MTDYKVPTLEYFEWQQPVEDKDLNNPPGGESKGDRYIVATGGGAWTGHDDEIATYNGTGWDFTALREGQAAWVKDENILYCYNGAAWTAVLINIVEDTTPQLGGVLDSNSFQIRWSKGADVASAAALPVLTDGNYFDVTGVAAITSINTMAAGTLIKLHFDGILTLTHHATDLVLPGGANITTAAGDEAEFFEYAAGDWRCTCYTKASGEAVVGGAVSPRESVEKTDTYVVLVTDGGKTFTMNAAAVAKQFTLPGAAAAGRGFWFKGVKGQAGDLSFTPNGADTIGRFGNVDVINDDADEAGFAFLILEVNYDEDGWTVHGDGTWHN